MSKPTVPEGEKAPGRARRSPRRWIVPIVRIPLIAIVGLTALLYSFQTRLIFPGQATQGLPEAEVVAGPDAELVRLETAGGDRVVALFGAALGPDGRPRPDAATRPTLLFFNGNGTCLKAAADQFALFRRAGANVLIPDYVGYGMSGGVASEAGCSATADAAFAHLRARKDVDPRRIVAGGWSLGAAVAIDLAAREPVAGVVALSGFTSMVDMARRNFPYLPARLLLRHRFASESKLRRVSCPILIGHGRDDALIPFAMAGRLAAAANGPVTRFAVDHAGHNDFFLIGEDQIADELRRFLDQTAPVRR